jgi:DNA-nicking Smr family endonuclease
MEGVRPLRDAPERSVASDGSRPSRAERVSAVDAASAAADALARARLASLVSGGVRFEVRRGDDGSVVGLRVGTDRGRLAALRRGHATPERDLDLHGTTAEQAEREVVAFVRAARSAGRRVVRVIHGKGLHSEGGIGVLGDHVVAALTEGGAAPFVLAFHTAAREHGGGGALLVLLT